MAPHPDAILAAEKTGHRRFLELCDPDHADYNPAYLAVVAGIAGKAPQPPAAAPPAAPAWKHERFGRAWLDRISTCPYRECRTGCRRSECHAGHGDVWGLTTMENCRSCLRGADARRPAP